jgi:signal transduction histidine kinase
VSVANSLALIINGVSVALSLVLLVLILWQDSRSEINLAFAGLILAVMLWTAGSLFSRATVIIGSLNAVTDLGLRLLEIGFTASCVMIYLFVIVVTGGQRRIFTYLALGAGALMITQLVIGFSLTPAYTARPDGALLYEYGLSGMLLYGSFAAVALFITLQRGRKFKERGLALGILGFTVGLLLELISPQLRALAITLDMVTISLLLLGYSLVRSQIIEPLAGRATQLQAVRDVGLAITSQLRLEQALSTVATQAAGILGADGAAIYLNKGNTLELAAVHDMPAAFLGTTLKPEEGVAGKVAATRQAVRLESYQRDWAGVPDMPYARQSFGSVVAAPLIFGEEVMGVLLVIAGVQGKRFDKDDLRLLELLGPQAAVAITNSRLFERRRALTDELEAAKNQLETLLMSTENPVLALNRKLEVLFANYAANDLLKQQTLAGLVITDLVPRSALPPSPMKALRDLHEWHIHTYELTARDRTYMCHLGLLGRDRAQGYVVVLNDISQLKELDRLKNQMIRMTSHDLKNPLAAAMMNTELLLEEGDEALTTDLRGYAHTIYAQLERMNRITRGILDLERVQSGKPAFEECPIDQLVRATAQEFESFAASRDVALTTDLSDDLPAIMGDRLYLSRAFGNLVENAIKFTKAGGAVRVSAVRNGSSVLVKVADTGAGIPPEAQSRIFERFFRLSPPGMEQISGTGLGLSLVKSVVDIHKGKIWLESAVGKGTTFHVALPIRQANIEWRAVEGE